MEYLYSIIAMVIIGCSLWLLPNIIKWLENKITKSEDKINGGDNE